MSHQTWSTELKVHPQIILEQANAYKTVEAAIKEFPINAWDADSNQFRLTISSDTVLAEDWGVGMNTREEIENFWLLGSPYKRLQDYTPVLKRPMIGQKGVGAKAAGAKIGKSVEVISRKAEAFGKPNDFIAVSEMKYELDSNGIVSSLKFGHEIHAARHPYTILLSHSGTKIRIKELRSSVDPKKVMEYFERRLYGVTTPLISQHPMKIYVNDQPVVSTPPTPPAGTIGKNVSLFCVSRDKSGQEKNYGGVKGPLWPSQSTLIDILVKAPVVATETLISPTHPVSGYVIADFLNVTTDRENIIHDGIYDAFVNQLNSYIAGHFPSKADYLLKREVKSLKVLTKLMDSLLEEDNFDPRGLQSPGTGTKYKIETTQPVPLPTIDDVNVGNDSDVPLVPIEPEIKRGANGEGEEKQKTKKPTTHVRSKYGMVYQFGTYGSSNPSIIITYGRTTVVGFNKETPYVKKCVESDGRLKNIMLAHLYATAYGLFKDRLQSISSVKDPIAYVNFIEAFETRMLSKMSNSDKD